MTTATWARVLCAAATRMRKRSVVTMTTANWGPALIFLPAWVHLVESVKATATAASASVICGISGVVTTPVSFASLTHTVNLVPASFPVLGAAVVLDGVVPTIPIAISACVASSCARILSKEFTMFVVAMVTASAANAA